MATLVEKRAELAAKQQALGRIFEAAGPDIDLAKVDQLKGFATTQDKANEIKRLNTELGALAQEVEQLAAVELAAKTTRDLGQRLSTPANTMQQPSGRLPETPAKSIGELFVESLAYTGYKGGGMGPVAEVQVEEKALFETTAGWAPEVTRTGRLALSAQEQPRVIDLLPRNTTAQASIAYMEETTYTNNAAEAAEAAQYAEAALALTEQTQPVRKIAVFLPVTDEQLEDVAYVRGYVNNRMGLMLSQRLDSQLIAGDGVAPNLLGFLNKPNILTQAKGADTGIDAIHKAITQVLVTGKSVASAIVMHPNDWQDIRLTRTADGIYILGSPNEAVTRLWGLPVVVSANETENTALVGAFAEHSELVMRRGVEFQVSNSHSDYFIKGKQAIRADVRCVLVIYRATGFCAVTGL